MSLLWLVVIALFIYLLNKLIRKPIQTKKETLNSTPSTSKTWLEEFELRIKESEKEISKPNKIKLKKKFFESQQNYVGRQGENIVRDYLSSLDSNVFYVFNNVRISSDKWLTYKGEKNLKSSEIDHVVLGPTGIFLIETKLWSPNFKSEFSPHEQIDRASRVTWVVLKNNFLFFNNFIIKKVVVSVNGSIKYDSKFKEVFVLRPGQLSHYIQNKKIVYSEKEIKKLVNFFRLQ